MCECNEQTFLCESLSQADKLVAETVEDDKKENYICPDSSVGRAGD